MAAAKIVPRCVRGTVPGEVVAELPSLLRTRQGVLLIEVKGVLRLGEDILIETDLDLNRAVVGSSQSSSDEEIVTLGELDLSLVDTQKTVSLRLNDNRLYGTVVKLRNPVAVLEPTDPTCSEIPVMEVISHKIVFNKQPEPVT